MPTYLVKQGNRYWARFQVPEDVRAAFDKREHWENLRTDDLKLAQARRNRALSDFRARVLEARGSVGIMDDDALAWRQTVREAAGTEEAGTVVDLTLEKAAERYVPGGLKAAQRAARLFHDEDLSDAVLDLGGPEARRFIAVALEGKLPLAPFVDPWNTVRKSEVEPKTAHMDRTVVERFVATFPLAADVTPPAVAAWIDKRRTDGDVSPSTLQREVSGLRSFWGYLKGRGEVPKEAPDPFQGLRFKGKAKDATRSKRQRFSPGEIAALYREALRRDDQDLADLIAIAAYSGARREEICALSIPQIVKGWFRIEDAKTEAGVREVPVHPRIEAIVKQRIDGRKAGYLFEDLDSDKYGNRGDALGKRFGRLKTAMGHGPEKAFHSIRHTFTRMLEEQKVPENLTADLIGHAKTTMSYGVYSGRGATRPLLGDAIRKVSYPKPL
ncbi:tyrosine-type recombinase/integrase [Reyranella sp.]|uniref:tyrosine-type recombinase/integrase n=1 Tax=Reyranella sp. TaxID=1929291 RepID=UPI003D11E251